MFILCVTFMGRFGIPVDAADSFDVWSLPDEFGGSALRQARRSVDNFSVGWKIDHFIQSNLFAVRSEESLEEKTIQPKYESTYLFTFGMKNLMRIEKVFIHREIEFSSVEQLKAVNFIHFIKNSK